MGAPRTSIMPPAEDADIGVAVSAIAPAVKSAERLLFIDNLRWVVIVLVVTMHAAVTYSGLGSWYYKEPIQPGPAALLFFVFYQTHLQAFFMGLLFLVAGYFVPGSFDRKGPARFIADRAWRLGVPTLIYALLIHPAMLSMLHGSSGLSVSAQLRSYARYVYMLDFLNGTGPMWFALALLVFTCIYVAARLAGTGRRAVSSDLPTHLEVAGLIAGMAAGSFSVRIVQPIGTSVMNMQLCFFTQYIVLFAVGIIARRRDWLRRLPARFALIWLAMACSMGPVLWMAVITIATREGGFDAFVGGMRWQSALYCFWESFFCIGVCLGLLVIFRERFNRQGSFARLLSRDAFTVYVIHAPILLAISLGMRNWSFPPFQKFLLLSALSLVASFAAAEVLLCLRDLLRTQRLT